MAAARRPVSFVHHQPVHEVRELAHAVHVVAVIDDDPDTCHVHQVESSRRLEEGRRERPQALSDVVQVGTRGPCCGSGRQRIRDVHSCPAAEGRRDEMCVHDRHRSRGEPQDHQLALGLLLQAEGGVATPRVAVDPVEAVLALARRHREQDHLARAMTTHAGHQGLVRVQDSLA